MILIGTVLCSMCILVPHEINEYYPDIVNQNIMRMPIDHYISQCSHIVGILHVVDVDAQSIHN